MLLAEHQQIPVEKDNEQSTFVRMEQKHILPVRLWPELEKLLMSESQPSYLESQTEFNLIESIYYDSPSLKIFTDHFTNRVSRLKVRTRRYAPNGEWKHKSVFIEVKKKADGICTKERLKLPVEQVALLANGEPLELSERLTKKNKSVDVQEVSDRVQVINGLVKDFGLRPQARVVYHRQAFEKDGFRVTVDNQLKYEILRDIDSDLAGTLKGTEFWNRALFMRSQFEQGNVMILELKHSGMVPDWMKDFLVQNSVNKAQFSKYCFTIASAILEG